MVRLECGEDGLAARLVLWLVGGYRFRLLSLNIMVDCSSYVEVVKNRIKSVYFIVN